MVHQHFMLIPVMTVAENIVLGDRAAAARPLLDMAAAERARARPLEPLRPGGRSARAGGGRQRRHAAAHRDPEGALPRREGADPRRADGGADAAGDRRPARPCCASCARAARRSSSSRTSSTRSCRSPTGSACCGGARRSPRSTRPAPPSASLAELMVGRPVLLGGRARHGATRASAVLTIEDLHVLDDREIETVRGLSLHGARRRDRRHRRRRRQRADRADRGDRRHAQGRRPARSGSATATSPTRRRAQAAEAGIGHIPQDRQRHGLVLDFSLAENTRAARLPARADLAPRLAAPAGDDQPGQAADRALRRARRLARRRPRARSRAATSRSSCWRARSTCEPQLLLAAQPTRGLDVGAIEFVHRQLIEQRDAGRRGAADLVRARRDLRPLRPHPRDVRGQGHARDAARTRRTRASSASR